MKYTIEATIPTQQYGNIKPMLEVDTLDGEAEAIETIKRLWSRFGETDLKDKVVTAAPTAVAAKVTTFTGEVVYYDKANHIYTDENGKQLLSGSKYAEKFSPKFDKAMILPKTAKSWEVEEKALDEIWALNSDISTNYGTALHTALELAHKYWHVGERIKEKKELDKNYVLPKNEFFADAVTKFGEQFAFGALSEVVISDVSNGMVGTVDRLVVYGDANVRIGDYKTNAELTKKDLDKYQKQLSFYAHILLNKGYKTEGLDIFHWDGQTWNRIELEVLPLES